MNSIWQKIIRTDNTAAAAILRLTVGLVMFPHGAQKMLGWFGGNGFAGTMDFFTGVMGIPALFAFLAIVTEFFGSLFLIAGALTRVWALGMTILMVVAAWMNHVQHGFFMNWMGQQAGEGFDSSTTCW